MKKGLTLAELLVVMVIIGIVSVGLITAYRQMFTQNTFSTTTAKDEQSAQIFTDQILKDLHPIGFGMWNNPGQPGSIHKIGNMGCGGLGNFATGDQGFLAIAKNCQGNNGDELYFFSLTARDFTSAGCWGIVENGGCLRVDSTNYLGNQCGGNIFTNSGYVVTMTPYKSVLSNVSCTHSATCLSGVSCQNALPGTMVFFKENYSYPSNFATTYFIADDANKPKTCAPNTFTLYKQVYSDSRQPVLSCVAAFKVRYILNNNSTLSYVDSISDLTAPNLVGIRLCMMIQVGTEAKVEEDVPTFTSSCGSITVHNAWRKYRWKMLEVDIPIKNR